MDERGSFSQFPFVSRHGVKVWRQRKMEKRLGEPFLAPVVFHQASEHRQLFGARLPQHVAVSSTRGPELSPGLLPLPQSAARLLPLRRPAASSSREVRGHPHSCTLVGKCFQ